MLVEMIRWQKRLMMFTSLPTTGGNALPVLRRTEQACNYNVFLTNAFCWLFLFVCFFPLSFCITHVCSYFSEKSKLKDRFGEKTHFIYITYYPVKLRSNNTILQVSLSMPSLIVNKYGETSTYKVLFFSLKKISPGLLFCCFTVWLA